MSKRLTTHEPRHLRSNNDRKHKRPRLREHNGEEFSRIAGREGTIPATPQVMVTRVSRAKIKKGNGKENGSHVGPPAEPRLNFRGEGFSLI